MSASPHPAASGRWPRTASAWTAAAGRSPQTLDEISRNLRISREGIRQIEARAIRKLRHALRESPIAVGSIYRTP
jgi:hypothetical protein